MCVGPGKGIPAARLGVGAEPLRRLRPEGVAHRGVIGIFLPDSPPRTRRRRRCEINDQLAPEVVGQIIVMMRAVTGAIAMGDFSTAKPLRNGVFRLSFCGRIWAMRLTNSRGDTHSYGEEVSS